MGELSSSDETDINTWYMRCLLLGKFYMTWELFDFPHAFLKPTLTSYNVVF